MRGLVTRNAVGSCLIKTRMIVLNEASLGDAVCLVSALEGVPCLIGRVFIDDETADNIHGLHCSGAHVQWMLAKSA